MTHYITTAIPYVNAEPHLGHALELVQADVLARHRSLRGDRVHFLTGTDDNALKNVTAAKAAGVPVREFVDQGAVRFAALHAPLGFDLEYPNLVAVFDAAVRLGADEVVAGLPQAMRVWFFRHRGTDDQTRMLEAAAAAAGRLGRDPERAELLSDLGFARAAAGRPAEALSAYEQALLSGPDDTLAAGLALRIGLARRDLGDLAAAQEQFRRAGELFGTLGQRAGQAQALAFDGWVSLHLGHRADAVELARASVAMAEGPGRITGLVTLGLALAPDEPGQALRTLHDALDLAEQHDLRHQQAWCHNHLGVALRVTGSPGQALEHHRHVFELLDGLAEAQLEIDCLHAYAETCRAAGHLDEARTALDRLAQLARKLDRPHDEKLARAALAALR
ncbi:class I tRNA ligase family protein [Amycolatopsis suaedae]|uniref:Methionyl-tRNA synthetase n=1 Tax=Amycolatopsis suaedae TaxID=2510978 RepID=A0A4Q7J9T5_9PSEU|nr:class I tRNA ligase family protein [Amycolatopsis suaedae]RZQ64550.1 hypothetical protein EWH70_06425 [Amycolatopsis suaedae]